MCQKKGAINRALSLFIEINLGHFDLKMISFMRSSFGDTTGTVSIVLATAISSSAVKVSLVMMPLPAAR